MRILYVEDNQANLMLVQRLARLGSHVVISHPDGETALTDFEQDKPDLVLIDVQLGGAMNGLDVVKALRTRGHKTPIIALTAYAMVGDRDRCLEAGCDAYLPKPLPVEELVELFQRYTPRPAADIPVSDTTPKPDAARESLSEAPSPEKPAATAVVPTVLPAQQSAPEATNTEADKPVIPAVVPASEMEATKPAAETDSKNT